MDDSVYAIEFNYNPELVTDLPFEVIFNSNGGSEVESQVVYENGFAVEPAAPTKSGYAFVAWYADKDLKNEFDFNTTAIKGITTLYAKWEEIAYQINYELNGGNELVGFNDRNEMVEAFLVDFYNYLNLEEVTLSDFMHGEGQTSGYNGLWINNADYSGKIYKNQKPEEVDEEYFASSSAYMEKWLPFFDMIDAYVKTVNNTQFFWGTSNSVGIKRLGQFVISEKPIPSLSDEVMAKVPTELRYAKTYTISTYTFDLQKPTKEGYVFKGWYTTADFSGEAVTTITTGTTGNLTLYAKWEEVVTE